MKTLLVEDNPGDAGLLRQMLQETPGVAGELVHVSRLSLAEASLREATWDLVLLDLNLPDGEGLESLRRVRATAPSVPVVVLSGLADEGLANQAVLAGAQDYLVKGRFDDFWLRRALRYAVERARAGEQLRRLNRALRTLSRCNEVLVHAQDEGGLIRELCQSIVEVGGYRLAWVGYAEQDDQKTVRPVGHAGIEEGYLETLQITWADTERGRGPTGTAIRTQRPVVCQNVRTEPSFAPWRTEAIKRGYASSIVLPLQSDGRTLGALSIYAVEPDAFDAAEAKLLLELAQDLAYGVVSLRARDDQRRAAAEVRRLNEELERRVAQRTEQLQTANAQLQAEVAERQRAEAEIRQLNADLARRAAELEAANHELEAFSYSVSHDLRAPLRAIDGFARILMEEHAPELKGEARQHLQVVQTNVHRMADLIDDLLAFSRLGRQAVRKGPVPSTTLVRRCLEELRPEYEGRSVEFRVGELCDCEADLALLKQVWLNLLGNALKYTRGRPQALIEVGCRRDKGERVYFVRDNGVGFDMAYAGKLFGVFQRLHRADEYEGTGVGLAIVQRIVHRHGGRVWAEAAVDRGATFYFTLEA